MPEIIKKGSPEWLALAANVPALGALAGLFVSENDLRKLYSQGSGSAQAGSQQTQSSDAGSSSESV